MFTNKGRDLVARKVGGLTDSCIDYLSVGIGARPIPSTIAGVSDNSHQSAYMTQMIHEVARVPVVSTLPTSNGIVKCMAELPNGLNCEFTEVALWTHGENAASSHPKTQIIAAFDPTENWKYNGSTELNPIITASGEADFFQHQALAGAGTEASYSPYNDLLWTVRPDRRINKEGFRLSTHGILMRGTASTIGSDWPFATPTGNYVSRSVNGLPFDTAGPDDELKFSYFISAPASTTPPTSTRFAIWFKTTDNKYAKWQYKQTQGVVASLTTQAGSAAVTLVANADLRRDDVLWSSSSLEYPTQFFYDGSSTTVGSLSMKAGKALTGNVEVNPVVWGDATVKTRNNSYFTQYTKLQNDTAFNKAAITYDTGFLWANVAEIIIYVETATDTYYVGFDALSFVNTDTANPGYGMVAYDIARNYETRGVITRQGSPTNIVFEVQIV